MSLNSISNAPAKALIAQKKAKQVAEKMKMLIRRLMESRSSTKNTIYRLICFKPKFYFSFAFNSFLVRSKQPSMRGAMKQFFL